MSEAGEKHPHPGLRLRIYLVDRATMRRTEVRATWSGPAKEVPLLSSTWPPCSCPKHRSASVTPLDEGDAP